MAFNKTENFIFNKASETKLPSVTIAVIRKDEVLWSKAFGFKDLERGLPATPDTLYCIGSVTKSFTSLAIMQLAEQGKLSLEDPVDKYLDFNIKPKGQKVRLHHLLTHTSGLPALAYAEAVLSKASGAGDYWLPISSIDDLLLFMDKAGDWVENKPGERWFYLNEGYAMLGAIIEKVSGKSYTEYVDEFILTPLGMERSTFARADFENDGNAAVPYTITDTGKQIPSSYPFGAIMADGGLISSVHEMAKYVSMYLGWGKLGKTQLLKKESIKEMEKGRIETPMTGGPFGVRMYGYALGTVPNFLGNKVISHSGSVGTATAFMGFIPEKNLGVVVLINGGGYGPDQIGLYALAEALGENPDELPFVKREALLKDLAGHYHTYKGTVKVQVQRAGDFLIMTMGSKHNTSRVPYIPVDLNAKEPEFYTLSGGSRLAIKFVKKEGVWTFIHERYALRKVADL